MNDLHAITQAVRVGQYMDVSDSHGEPIALTSAFVFASAAEAAGRFSGALRGNVYSRFTNPTVRSFEQRVAALEGAEDAVAFASGMAAIAALGHAWLQSGDNIVCARDVFGTTLHAFRHYFGRFGIVLRVVDLTRLDEWQAAVGERTRLVFLETPSNPLQQVADVPAIARIAHAAGALLVVDNTMLTPVQQQPLALGADLVLHSAGKYMDGQGRCMGGVVAGASMHMAELRNVLRTLGSSLSAANAWLLLKGLETLHLRMARIGESALQLADWLAVQPGVGAVHYSGRTSHPHHALARQQQSGFGGVLSFEAGLDRDDAWRVVDALKLVSIATHIGDTRSMVTHPASTTHGRLSPREREQAGIGESLLRLSVGLEHPADLMADLSAALQTVALSALAEAGSDAEADADEDVDTEAGALTAHEPSCAETRLALRA